MQRRRPAGAGLEHGGGRQLRRHARHEHLPQPQRQRAAAGRGRARAAAAVLRRRAEHAASTSVGRRQVVVRRAAGEARQALLARAAGAGGLHVLEDARTRRSSCIPSFDTRAPAIGQGARHPAHPRRELDLRAAVRAGQGVRQRRQRGRAEAARGLGDQRHHAVSARRSAQHPRRQLAPEHRQRQLGRRHLRPTSARPSGSTQWFDTSCFANPAQFQFGNYESARSAGRRCSTTDFSLFKRTALGGNRSMEVRLETFNVFNRAHFSNPNTSFGNSQFGRISSTRLPSRESSWARGFCFSALDGVPWVPRVPRGSQGSTGFRVQEP